MRRTLATRWLLSLSCCAAGILEGDRTVAAGHWLRTYADPFPASDSLADIEPVPAGGYVAVGSTVAVAGNHNDVWVVRLDGDGGVVWQKRFHLLGDEFGYAVRATHDGGFIVGAQIWGGIGDAWILKLDALGNLEWQRRYGGADDAGVLGIVELDGGDFVFAGPTWEGGGGLDTSRWIVRIGPTGDIVWKRVFWTSEMDGVNGVLLTRDGNLVVYGTIFPYPGTEGPMFLHIAKYDLAGNVLAQTCFGDVARGESLASFVEAADGGYLAIGSTDTAFGNKAQTLLHRLDANLTLAWSRKFWLNGMDFAAGSIVATPDGGAVISGVADAPWLVRTDAEGGILWQHRFQFSASAHLSSLIWEPDAIVSAGRDDSGFGRAMITRLSHAGLLPGSCGLTQSLAAIVSVPSIQSVSCGTGGGVSNATAAATAAPAAPAVAVTTTRCEDLDADGLATGEDNCPFAANAAQDDFDADEQGDACDTDDGLLYFTEVTPLTLAWQADTAYSTFNLYRGSLGALAASHQYTQDPGVNSCAARTCSLSDPTAGDAMVPDASEPCFYLVSGNGAAGESSLADPTSGPRPNDHPCP